jgi:chloramphenicol O-acetyltransferase type A
MYSIIDQSKWVRKNTYTHFQSFDNPTWDLLCDVRITAFYDGIKSMEGSFFLSFLHAASTVCNAIPELRCRIDNEGHVRQYDVVHPGSTILYDNGTYGYVYFNYHADYQAFIKEAKHEMEAQKQRKDADPKDEDLARTYFSPIPWVSFSGFRHPYRKAGNTSIPMIVFGKHYERDGERWLPVGLALHHGLADGLHAGMFFNQLQSLLENSFDKLNGR